MDPYVRLADAVIVQAAKDYRERRHRDESEMLQYSINLNRKRIKDIEEFFKSNYCEVLSRGTNGEILRRLKEECDQIDADRRHEAASWEA